MSTNIYLLKKNIKLQLKHNYVFILVIIKAATFQYISFVRFPFYNHLNNRHSTHTDEWIKIIKTHLDAP